MMSSRLNFIRPRLLNSNGIASWFTCKNGDFVNADLAIPGLNLGLKTGEEETVVMENRKRLFQELDLDEDHIAFGEQVHDTNIEVVKQGGTYKATDALVTKIPGMALAIQVADCAAVLMGDMENKIIAAAHAGWRGAVGDIIPKTIQKMKELGADTDHIRVFVSPCLSQKNFEVGNEVAVQFPDEFVDRENYKKPHVDLKGFIRHQLLDKGILKNHVEVNYDCTIDDESYYSYRREGEKSGRMMGIIKLQNVE